MSQILKTNHIKQERTPYQQTMCPS